MSESESTTKVHCPCCDAELVVDTKTGKVLMHEEPKREIQDFDQLLSGLDEQKARAEDIFEREKAAHEDRDRLMEERFKAAVKKAEETPDEPIVRPWDLD